MHTGSFVGQLVCTHVTMARHAALFEHTVSDVQQLAAMHVAQFGLDVLSACPAAPHDASAPPELPESSPESPPSAPPPEPPPPTFPLEQLASLIGVQLPSSAGCGVGP